MKHNKNIIEYNKINISLQKLCRKLGREANPRPLFAFWKSIIKCKREYSSAWFHYISKALKLAYSKNKLYKTLDYSSRDILNFDFLEKGLVIVSPQHFVYNFSTKTCLMPYSINWPNIIVWLPTVLEILGNISIAVVSWPVFDAINFEINLICII